MRWGTCCRERCGKIPKVGDCLISGNHMEFSQHVNAYDPLESQIWCNHFLISIALEAYAKYMFEGFTSIKTPTTLKHARGSGITYVLPKSTGHKKVGSHMDCHFQCLCR